MLTDGSAEKLQFLEQFFHAFLIEPFRVVRRVGFPKVELLVPLREVLIVIEVAVIGFHAEEVAHIHGL